MLPPIFPQATTDPERLSKLELMVENYRKIDKDDAIFSLNDIEPLLADAVKLSDIHQYTAVLKEDSNLLTHAKQEFKRLALAEELEDSSMNETDLKYGKMIEDAVTELLRTFAAQGHSGFSAGQTLHFFNELAQFKALAPLTDAPSEWQDHSTAGNPLWQNRRNSEAFSLDGGKTYYYNSEVKRRPSWLTWIPGVAKHSRKMYTSAPATHTRGL